MGLEKDERRAQLVILWIYALAKIYGGARGLGISRPLVGVDFTSRDFGFYP